MFDNYLYPKRVFVNNVNGKEPIIVTVPLSKEGTEIKFSTKEMKLMNFQRDEIIYLYSSYTNKKEALLKAQNKRKYDDYISKATKLEEDKNYQML
jgi:aconitase B